MKYTNVLIGLLFVLGVYLIFSFFGEKAAMLLGFVGLGGAGAVRKVKANAKKKHSRIADDPDAIQRDNLDRLKRRGRRKLGKT